MKLCRPTEVVFGPEAVSFRQGRLAGTIRMGLLAAIFLAIGPIQWRLGLPWFIWLPCLLVGLLPGLILPGAIKALYLKSNWVLAIDRQCLWINIRSPFNYRLPEAHTIIQIGYSEIKSVSLCSESFSTPDSEGGSRNWKINSVQLNLAQDSTLAVAKAVEEEQKRRPPSGGLSHHYPVSVPEPGKIRISWRGSSVENCVTPGADKALQALAAAGVHLEKPGSEPPTDWSKLGSAEVDEFVRNLALSGHRIEAAKLLVQKKGLTLTEAKRQVEQITS